MMNANRLNLLTNSVSNSGDSNCHNNSFSFPNNGKIFAKNILSLSGIFILIFLLLQSNKSFASHSSGSDLTYTWISGTTYKVTVSFYRDCAGVSAPASISLNAVSSSCNKDLNFTLNLVSGTGQEITFPCRSVQTKCTDPASPYTGYELYKYSNTVTLPQACSDWKFSYWVCCRNCAITTLNNPCSDNLYVEATLNNLVAPTNSSPQFTNIPVAFLCVNQGFTYNHGVFDPDGDSLVYSFISPMTFNSGNSTVGTVTFNPGYSASQPLTSSPAVSLNTVTGDIVMFPTVNNEIGVGAIMVKEYRNGTLIGSVVRDMQFLTKVCNPNMLPTASGINGTAVFSAVACPGMPFTFHVNSNDPNALDTVTMTWASGIPTANFTSTSARLPVGTFTWTPTQADARSQPYSMIVTVRDNACPTNGSQTYSYSITVPTMSASASSPTYGGFNIACKGSNNGTASATGTGGTMPYLYSWNPSAQTSQTAVNLGPGNYTVTVTDASGCTKTSSISLTEPPTLLGVAIGSTTNVSCFGGNNGSATATASGGVGSYTYLWTPSAQTTVTATGLSSAIYTVRVTDANGCTALQGVAINQPSALNASVTSFTNVTCRNNDNGTINTTASGGTGPYTHHWSNGSTSQNIIELGPGTYSDTIRDSQGCVRIISQTITQPASSVSLPSSSLSTSNVSCFGGSDGNANVNPGGGTPAYTVTWSNGDIGNSADSLFSGNYSVHIVDGNGCTYDTSISITEPAVLSTSFTNFSNNPSGNNITCKGDSTGKVKVAINGGTSPFNISWSTGSTTDSIFNMPAGTYNVQVTDIKGCIALDTVTLDEPTAALNDSLTVKDVGCKGESTGGIRAVTFGGSSPYSYTWSHGAFSTDSVGNLAAGFYQVTISDVNNCQRVDTITVQEPDSIVPLILPSTYIGAVNVDCHGDSTGSATLNVFGGTRPFTYMWSTAAVDSFVTGIGAGNISVRVVDANGCSIVRDTALMEPSPFLYNPVISNPKCYGDATGFIVLNTTGSTGPYTYAWTNSGSTDSIGNLNSGAFGVVVTDANNCKDSVGYSLTDPDSITAFATVTDFNGYSVSCIGGTNAAIKLNPSGGTGGFTFLWSNSMSTDSIGNLSASAYSVSIYDANGCRRDTSFMLTQPTGLVPAVQLSLYNGTNVSCFGYNDGVAHSTVTGGVPPYTYLWSNGDVADSALGLTSGNYSLTVTDTNGCSSVIPFSLNQPTPLFSNPVLSNFNGYTSACAGDSSSCVTLSASGGNGPYMYVWNIQDTINSPTLCNIPSGTVLVSVIDANGCQLDTTIILTSPPPLIPSAVISSYSGYGIQCNGMSNGFINFTVNGGIGPFTYAWSNSDNTQNISNLVAGNYFVVYTDANLCSDTITYTLNEPPVVSALLSMTSTTCSFNNGSALATPVSGISPFSYSWSPSSQTSSQASGLSAGWHSITLTDSVGCVFTDSILIGTIPVMSIAFTNQVPNDCPGNFNGSVQAVPSGGLQPYSFNWSNGDTTFTAAKLPGGIVKVSVTDASGCVESDSSAIAEFGVCDLDLPSAFSPNGDSYNDGYLIRNIESYPVNEFKVFNRWGNEVFSKSNYQNTDWVGQNATGGDLPAGTYFVILEIKDKGIRLNTFVDLRRAGTQ